MAKAKKTLTPAEQKAADAAVKKAEREKLKAQKKAEREARQREEEKRVAAEEREAERVLAPIAKEVNVRIEKIAKLDGQADDHRLSAALKLAEAKTYCDTRDISFKKWAESHLHHEAAHLSFETLRKLAYVGQADDPKLALADMRGKNRKANAEARKRQKAQKQQAGQQAGGHVRATGNEPTASKGPTKTAFQVADEAIASMPEKAAISLLDSRAAKLGKRVVSADEAEAVRIMTEQANRAPKVEEVMAMFLRMAAGAKLNFLKQAAAAIGVEIKTDVVTAPAAADPDNGQVPAALRRAPSRRPAASAAS